MNSQLVIPRNELAVFCRANGVRWLAIFGSALRADFGSDSDVDVLVECEPGRTPGLPGVAGLEMELSALLGGREVDLSTPEDLSRYFCQDVLDAAEVQYAQGWRDSAEAYSGGCNLIGFFVGSRERSDLDADRRLIPALVKEIEIVGEAAARTTDKAPGELPGVPWSQIVRMRNRLVHARFHIGLDILWQTVQVDLPPADRDSRGHRVHQDELGTETRALNATEPGWFGPDEGRRTTVVALLHNRTSRVVRRGELDRR